MYIKNVNFYYRQILSKFKNSYLVEDLSRIIIGIDCDYLDANDLSFSQLKLKYELLAQKSICDHAGLFGIFSWNFISLLEKIPIFSSRNYDFPLFLFANAKAYLIYEKEHNTFLKFGDLKYFDYLRDDFNVFKKEKNYDFEILNCLKEENKDFLKMCEKAKEYLINGDIFQVVLSKQLCIKHQIDAFDYYEQLRTLNPSIYMFYFPSKYGVVLGSSPEFLLKIKDKEIFLAPIAGTRSLDNDCDINVLEKELLNDEKELSEHKMLVDLARNDASKFGINTRVENLFSIIKNKFIMHIVSEVYATMKENVSIFDVIEAVFPAGTLSGAPKIRALEIIRELEMCDRGIYGGAIGFLNFKKDVVLAILIRSTFFTKDRAYISSGAGIVLQSDSKKEYEEICAKRRALLLAFKNLKKENDDTFN
ncbi:anthranilate synthase component I family protein [Campylobacter hepaticus]|uniref:Anthranilate synthase component I family protein n=1 Tax=Campylobacter hepaticus TaxID=1813019 RepID=A0A6A7JQI5_9BACT|nr:anthranilate synthase component I family protein [Campylobacter hepaticus]AXP09440.1 anthranilate synthase component I family protein [Campylobacter hepaticus]MCZ0772813.1 anthranilate synthase component I family protein [Campylobacter hepaticus]MCZ0774282.1 anthranilate synthase component I family protein [Campylobacter hepaticus]MCZ0775534.1 anthranilate synthase component I family protein [Campylobacter hepaticus]MDX2323183.1 anthranilate synthase component I family protein [Campylobacte